MTFLVSTVPREKTLRHMRNADVHSMGCPESVEPFVGPSNRPLIEVVDEDVGLLFLNFADCARDVVRTGNAGSQLERRAV